MPVFNNNAEGLIDTTGVVNISGSAAPTAGQVLEAIDGYNATWQTPAATSGIVQDLYSQATTDISTTSGALVDMTGVTITLTTGNSELYIWWVAGVETSSSGATASFSLNVDGTAICGVNSKPGGTSSVTVALIRRVSVSAGSHTVKIRWAISSGTLRCNALSSPSTDNSALIVFESTNA